MILLTRLRIDIQNDAQPVTADVEVLNTSISHELCLKALRNALENRNHKQILTENLIKMTESVLKNNW